MILEFSNVKFARTCNKQHQQQTTSATIERVKQSMDDKVSINVKSKTERNSWHRVGKVILIPLTRPSPPQTSFDRLSKSRITKLKTWKSSFKWISKELLRVGITLSKENTFHFYHWTVWQLTVEFLWQELSVFRCNTFVTSNTIFGSPLKYYK